MTTPRAILLVGPTASGKTPLGDAFEHTGVFGHSCRHFDFGSRLRGVIEGVDTCGMTDAEVTCLKGLIAEGRLLADHQFHLAEKILDRFLDSVPGESLIVLNGLPRHLSQAAGVDRILNVQAVIELSCTEETVLKRIAGDPDGDRSKRTDDQRELVKNKLMTYLAQTEPVLDHYRRKGVRTLSLMVGPDTISEDLIDALPDRLIDHN